MRPEIFGLCSQSFTFSQTTPAGLYSISRRPVSQVWIPRSIDTLIRPFHAKAVVTIVLSTGCKQNAAGITTADYIVHEWRWQHPDTGKTDYDRITTNPEGGNIGTSVTGEHDHAARALEFLCLIENPTLEMLESTIW
jgi:hypothetical protein